MAAELTGLVRRAVSPQVYRCACGCGAFASRGVPDGRWFAPHCLPPHLRCAHEPEYRPLVESAPSSAGVPSPATAAPDLLSGLCPA